MFKISLLAITLWNYQLLDIGLQLTSGELHIAEGFLKNSVKEVEKYQVEKQQTSAVDFFLSMYSVVSIKRTGCNKRTGGENSPKIVKRTGCIKQTGWTFCQK